MYSPKISKEFIAILYQKAKDEKIPMTKLVNRIIGHYVNGNEHNAQNENLKKKTT